MAESIESQGDVPSSNDVYFSSYEDMTVHELMLKDEPRTMAYKNYIEKNAALFKDKVVIDVGAGSGILSLFAAKAGAKKVYAIEASNVANLCKTIVRQNNLDHVIEVVRGRVEDVVLPIQKADILISEWMGFYLLHEAMLNSVIVARERWLSHDGLMVPSTASLFIAPVQMTDYYKENALYWTKAYGFDLSPIAELVKRKNTTQPSILDVKPECLLSEPELLCHLDLMYVAADDLKTVLGNFGFSVQKNAVCHGFTLWFDCLFEGNVNVELGTGPLAPSTHWQQTVMFLPDAYFVSKGDVLSCQFKMEQDTTIDRRYNISLEIVEEETDDEEDEDEADMVSDEHEVEEDGKEVAKQAIVNAMMLSNNS